jgi:predicted  nucleic acid-binding Zn-ribbon protein
MKTFRLFRCDVPEGAPLLCRVGRHKGQEAGGLMIFQCPRCGGDYWQTDPKYTAAMDQVRLAESRDDYATASRIYERTMGRPHPAPFPTEEPCSSDGPVGE